MYHSKITGLGYYVPDNIVTNNDLKEFMETSDEWITTRTGIKERRILNRMATRLGINEERIKELETI